MDNQQEYLFWFPDGKSPSVLRREKEDQAFETFLQKVLTADQLRTRQQMRRMESAVKIVVDELMEMYKN